MIAPYRQFWLLSAGAGWRAALTGLTADASGALALDPLPGKPAPLAAFAGLSPLGPLGLAAPAGGPVYVLCEDGAQVFVGPHGCQTAVRPVPGVGAGASGARRLDAPQDVAASASGEIFIADSESRSIKVFETLAYGLLAVWPVAGRPVRLALAGDDDLWVLDAEGRRVIRLDRDGRLREVAPGLDDPHEIAACEGALAALDGDAVKVRLAGAAAPVSLATVTGAASLAFGPNQTLYVGDAAGLIHVFARTALGWREAGVGVLGQAASVRRLVVAQDGSLLALVVPEGATDAAVWKIDPAGARVRVGGLASEEIDSRIDKCGWHRIALDADLPAGTAVEVRTQTYDQAGGRAPQDLTPAAIMLSGDLKDCLVQKSAGRYLKITLTLRGDGSATPVLRAVRIWAPRVGWLEALPPLYREDAESADFLARFLALLQTSYDGFDETIDDIWKLFDPRSVPANLFAWLANWIALPLNPRWSDAKRRAVLRGAFKTYQVRGTPAGLEQLVADYAGVPARVVEHFKLRRWIQLADAPDKGMPLGAGRLFSRDAFRRWQVGFYSQVGQFKLASAPAPALQPLAWGAHQFSVCYDASPLTDADVQKDVVEVVEREKPAHAQAFYRPVFARMRVGVQATLGVDTRVGEIGEAVLCRVSRLGYDAVLACPKTHDGPRRARPPAPRLGLDARLS
jgi:phage tail-like protein